MRLIKIVILAAIGIALVVVALANRDMVTLRLLPAEFADLFGLNASVNLPLFLVILGGVVVGLIIGFIWEWLREHKHRAVARHRQKEVVHLERRLQARRNKAEGEDDVLALLEDAEHAR